MTIVTIPQVYMQWQAFGVGNTDARKMTAIALRETGGTLDTNSRHYNPPIEDSYGIYQINMLAHAGSTTVACATDFACSSRFALGLYKANHFQDWAGTQDEPGLQPFYAKVDAALGGAGIGPDTNTTGQWASGTDTPSLEEGVRDFMIVLILEIVGLMCVGIGLWGLVTGKDTVGSTLQGAASSAYKLGKTAVSAAVDPAVAAGSLVMDTVSTPQGLEPKRNKRGKIVLRRV